MHSRQPPRQSTTLILGASFLQEPMIRSAKSLGFHTIVVDKDPSAPAIPYADEFYQASTTDLAAVREIARKHHLDGITTAATDMPVRVVAALGAELRLPAISPEAALACTDKAVMISVLAEAGVPHPEFGTACDLASARTHAERIGFPCIVKPTDASGSRGVMLVNEPAELSDSFEYALRCSKGHEVLIEEYLSGPEVSCEVFHDGDRARVLAVTDKRTSGAPHFVETGHSQPSRLPSDTIDQVKAVACAAALALGVTMGPAHAEIIITDRGPVIVEVGARLGGDCITSHLVPLSTGIDLIRLVLSQSVGNSVHVPEAQDQASAIRFIEFPPGRLKNVSGVQAARSIEHVVEVALLKPVGTTSAGTRSSNDRLGYVIAAADSVSDAVSACDNAVSLIEVEVED